MEGLTPRFENNVDACAFIKLADDGCTIDWEESTNSRKNVNPRIVVCNLPITHPTIGNYFEIHVNNLGASGIIAIGLMPKDASFSYKQLPGWQQGYGFQGDDGKKFTPTNSGVGENYGPKWSKGSQIGCGYDEETNTIFFTANGNSLGPAYSVKGNIKHYYPVIGMRSNNKGSVHVNFQAVWNTPLLAVPMFEPNKESHGYLRVDRETVAWAGPRAMSNILMPRMVVANLPITHSTIGGYFELNIKNRGVNGLISVGLVRKDKPIAYDGHVGWQSGMGYHGDDGNKFFNSKAASYGPLWTSNSVVGCGYDADTNSVFFTYNRVFLGNAFVIQGDVRNYYPAIALRSNSDAEVVANFAAKAPPFTQAPKFELNKEANTFMKVTQDNNISWVGKHDEQYPKTIITNVPITHPSINNYLEITVLDNGSNGELAFGLLTKVEEIDFNSFPGWFNGCGFHGDDGLCYAAGKNKIAYGPKWQKGAVIGCGYDERTCSVFFTYNGTFLGTASILPYKGHTYYPCISMCSCKDGNVLVNFQAQYKLPSLVPRLMPNEAAAGLIDLNGDGTKMTWVAPYQGGREGKEIARSLVANVPLVDEKIGGYFEIRVKNLGVSSYLGIGVMNMELNIDFKVLPGWKLQGYGYHADDGNKYGGDEKGQRYAQAWQQDAVVGCGYDEHTNSIYFTYNGINLGTSHLVFGDIRQYYPTVGMDNNPGAEVIVNFSATSGRNTNNNKQQPAVATVTRALESTNISSIAPQQPVSPPASPLQENPDHKFREWLGSIGMSEWYEKLKNEGADWLTLQHIDENFLKEIGMPILKRKQLLTEISKALSESKAAAHTNDNNNNPGKGSGVLITGNMSVGRRLGEGHFGEVYQGRWDIHTVALKRIKTGEEKQLIAEAAKLQNLRHPNIVQYFGIYRKETAEMYMVTEFLHLGDVASLLRDNKSNITQLELLYMARDAASGMKYLAQNGIIHRDLAARNLLATSDQNHKYVVKVGDFGLAREVNDESLYASSTRMFPVKWTAPESMTTGKFNIKSDVWSFGITLYEIMAYGSEPYADVPQRMVLQKVTEQNYRMAKPDQCPEEVYGLMQKCWDLDPHNRPDFAVILDTLCQLIDSQEGTESEYSKPIEGVYNLVDGYSDAQ